MKSKTVATRRTYANNWQTLSIFTKEEFFIVSQEILTETDILDVVNAGVDASAVDEQRLANIWSS